MEEELDLFININKKRGALIKKHLILFLQIILIVFLMTINLKAQTTNFYQGIKIRNNILSLDNLSKLNFNNISFDKMAKINFGENEMMTHHFLNTKGMKFEFDNFSIEHLNKFSESIVLSDSAMSFINRLNKFNYLREFDNIKAKEEKIDFNVTKLSYKKEIYNAENLTVEINSDFNYYQGSNYEYNIYDLNIDVGKSTNSFFDLPLIINGNAKEYFNNSSNNSGTGFGLGIKVARSNNLEIIFSVDNIGAHINWRDLQLDDFDIDTETVYKDQFDNLKYNSTISGKWKKFDFKMSLPRKTKLLVSKELNNMVFCSNLNWQEWEIEDISRDEVWNWENIIGYRLNEYNTIYLGYDFFTEIYSFKFNNEKINMNLYLENLVLKESNENGFDFSYSLKF
jgi:hypothetical protein